MRKKINHYKLYRFNSKDNYDCIFLDEEQGVKLIIELIQNADKKFVLIGDDLINTSSIERIDKEEQEVEEWQIDKDLLYRSEKARALLQDFKNKGLKSLKSHK